MAPGDTSPEAEAIQIQAFALAGWRERHPDWSEAELRRELLRSQFPPDAIPPPLR